MNSNRREFLLSSAALAVTSYSGAVFGAAYPEHYEGGMKRFYDYVPVVVLSGSWSKMGEQYGYFLGKDIKVAYDMVAAYRDKVNPISGKINVDIIDELYASYPANFKEFFQGMAKTSGLSLEQLKTANAIEMILTPGENVYNPVMNTRCSALSTWGEYSRGGSLVYGRNYDYYKGLDKLNDHVVVTVFHPSNGDIPFAICGWAGCIYASTGINKSGLFVEENDCSSHDKETAGLVMTDGHYDLKTWVRDDVQLLSLLTSAHNMGEADSWMKRNLPIYPHNIGVADKKEARCYQWNVKKRVPYAPHTRQGDGVLAITNHYFNVPRGWDLAPYAETDANGGAIPSGSLPRVNNLLALAEKLKEAKIKIDMDKMCDIMDVKLADGGATVDNTLFQIVCEPEHFRFRLKTLKRSDRWVDIPLRNLLF